MSKFNLEGTTIVVSSNALKENSCEEVLKKAREIKPGMDIVMAGSIAIASTLKLAKKYENVLREKFAASFVEDCFRLEKVSSTEKYEKIAKKHNAALIFKLGKSGVFGGGYELAKLINHGITIEIPKIPVWQETIEVSEVFDVNPYKSDSEGAIYIVCNSGTDMVEYLTDEGIYAEHIGSVTDTNDKVAVNGDEVRYLEPSRVDELGKLI